MKHIIGLVLAVVIIVCACSAPQTKTEENFENIDTLVAMIERLQ